MNITVITQEDPFYLPQVLDNFFSRIPSHSKVVSCVLLDVSPFGKRESFLKKALKTVRIFGVKFFTRYCIKYIVNKAIRKNSVSKVLRKHAIPIITLDKSINSPESLERVREHRPDLLISIAGNEVFKRPLIELAPKGCINLHTALLPKYRGLMPSFWCLKNNEDYTGASVFFVDEGIDSGPIIVQKKIEIGNKSLEELILHSKRAGMDAILESIEKIESGNLQQLVDNPESEKTYYTFPTRQDVVEFRRAGKRFY